MARVGRTRIDYNHIPLSRRRELVEQARGVATINGHRASLGGARRGFAVVTDLETGLSAEWSWDAVERILSKGGEFKS